MGWIAPQHKGAGRLAKPCDDLLRQHFPPQPGMRLWCALRDSQDRIQQQDPLICPVGQDGAGTNHIKVAL